MVISFLCAEIKSAPTQPSRWYKVMCLQYSVNRLRWQGIVAGKTITAGFCGSEIWQEAGCEFDCIAEQSALHFRHFATQISACIVWDWLKCGLRATDCGLRVCGLRATDCGLRATDCGLRVCIAGCGPQIAGCGYAGHRLQSMGHRLWSAGKVRAVDY